MPIERTGYQCQYKCRKPIVLDRKRMEKHEARCLKNPDVRSCATCEHDMPGEAPDMINSGSGYPGMAPECAKDARGDKNCIINCREWKQRA